MKQRKQKPKKKWWQKLLIALGALVVAAALAVGGLTLTVHLSHARFMRRSLDSDAVQAFSVVLEAMPFEEYEPVRWRLAAPDGGAWFAYDNFNITMVADAASFIAAGLNVAKLENAVEHNLNPGNVSISFDTPGFNMMNAWEQDTDIKQFAWALGSLKEYLVTLEDRYYIDLGDSLNMRGGALFAWAKDLTAGESDIVFAINPEPLIAVGVDPAKVEGWDYIQIPVSQDGEEILAYQFVKVFGIKEAAS